MDKKSLNLYKVKLAPAKCGLDLGDGSERAEYVNQDYILYRLGRPHRCINIMYTYYPQDEYWPSRISEACADMEIHFQWDYPYDDYFPYGANGEPFNQMRDIRRHGQDVALTLTIDCSLSDDYLRDIAKQLKPFGNMRLRINHECSGDWFTHNRRFTYAQVGEFFVRFHKIIKEEAPNIRTVFCAGLFDDSTGKVQYEDEFAEAYRLADYWSADCYLALHYGWPFDVCEKGCGSYSLSTVESHFERYKKTADRLKELNNGVSKPLMISEFNVDGDVVGAFHQGDAIKRFLKRFKDADADWFGGVTLYQFRDRGRLGLEIEDPNNSDVGIEQPLLSDYREIISDSYFAPDVVKEEETALPLKLRWGSAEDADGFAIDIHFEKNPEFCEITFEEPLSLMMELNGHWFYKAPETKTIDLMPAFFKSPLAGEKKLMLTVFATPPDGVNDESQGNDWNYNYYTEMTKLPELRIRYEAIGEVL